MKITIMKKLVVALFYAIALFCATVFVGAAVAGASGADNRRWTMYTCGTLDCVTQFLNTLPVERALEAKIVVINSQRSFLGVLSDPYYIYYRK